MRLVIVIRINHTLVVTRIIVDARHRIGTSLFTRFNLMRSCAAHQIQNKISLGLRFNSINMNKFHQQGVSVLGAGFHAHEP
jgi:hypothetical protein